MAVRVPNSTVFSLQHAVNAVADHTLSLALKASPTDKFDLQDCYVGAEADYFDPNYNNNSYAEPNSLKRFRNYGPPYCYVSNVEYQNSSPSIDYNSRGVWFNSTGQLMIVLYRDAVIKLYNLSTAWDVSTAIYHHQKTLNSGDQYSGLHLNSYGTAFLTVNTTEKRIEKWTLSIAWNFTTASFSPLLSTTFIFSSIDTGVMDIALSSDGMKLFFVGNQYTYTKLYQYDLSSAWDLTIVSYAYTLDISTNHPLVGVFLSSDDKKVFTLSQYTNYLRQVNLATAGELSTWWWDCIGTFLGYYDTHATAFFIRERISGTPPYVGELDIYISGTENNKVYKVITNEEPLV